MWENSGNWYLPRRDILLRKYSGIIRSKCESCKFKAANKRGEKEMIRRTMTTMAFIRNATWIWNALSMHDYILFQWFSTTSTCNWKPWRTTTSIVDGPIYRWEINLNRTSNVVEFGDEKPQSLRWAVIWPIFQQYSYNLEQSSNHVT